MNRISQTKPTSRDAGQQGNIMNWWFKDTIKIIFVQFIDQLINR